jgi:hypothetical protein
MLERLPFDMIFGAASQHGRRSARQQSRESATDSRGRTGKLLMKANVLGDAGQPKRKISPCRMTAAPERLRSLIGAAAPVPRKTTSIMN